MKDFRFFWIQNPKDWTIEKVFRFNSGCPYISYRFGPIFIQRFVRFK